MILNAQLDTLRLYIRPFIQEDIPRLVTLLADPLVAQFVDDGAPLSKEGATTWVSHSRANLDRFGYGTGAVVVRRTGEMIGWAGIARPEGHPKEIIYGLGQRYWRQGYGSELVYALADFAEERDLNPVRATVHSGNVASIILLQNAGFELAERHFQGDTNAQLYLRYKQACE